jgi:hypothetical protein
LNDRYKGTTHSGEVLEIAPDVPAMKIVAQDASGANQIIHITIEKEE